MKAKLIEYAYPSSPFAVKSGYGNLGCWYVCLYNNIDEIGKTAEILQIFTDKKEAINFADSLPNPYSWLHKYFN